MIKRIVRSIIPEKIRNIVYRCTPKVYMINTNLLNSPKLIEDITSVNERFIINGKLNIKEISIEDAEKLKKFADYRGESKYKQLVQRLNDSWIGLGVIDKTNGDIAYMGWIINKSIPCFEEYGLKLKPNQFLLKDGFCVPEYRHQGLHTRMEQERINYCVRNGATGIFNQVISINKKGKDSVYGNGFRTCKRDILLWWPIFGIFRPLKAFLKNPFRKIVK